MPNSAVKKQVRKKVLFSFPDIPEVTEYDDAHQEYATDNH